MLQGMKWAQDGACLYDVGEWGSNFFLSSHHKRGENPYLPRLMMRVELKLFLLATFLFTGKPMDGLGDAFPKDGEPLWVREFFESNCLECHDSAEAEGGLDLEQFPLILSDPKTFARWVQLFDRIESQEMPPREGKLSAQDRQEFLELLGGLLESADWDNLRNYPRSTFRRLTRLEFEYNLRDFLQLPHLDVRDRLPEDRTSHGFSKAAASLDMSRVQLAAYLDAAETALLEAMASGIHPTKPLYYMARGTDLYPKLGVHAGRESMHFSKHGKMVPVSNTDLKRIQESGEQDPEMEMALFRSATWPFYGYPRGFLAEHGGTYKVRFSARAVRQLPGFRLVPALRPVPMTFRARQPSLADVSGDVRATGGIMDIQPEPDIYETTIQLKAGETFEYSLLGLPVPHPITSHGGPLYYNFPPMPPDGHRGIAFRWLEVTGPLSPERWPSDSHRILFGDLPLHKSDDESRLPVEVVSSNPKADAKRLMHRFGKLAARRPISEDNIEPFVTLIYHQLEEGNSFAEAVATGYQAFLCSSSFLSLVEPSFSYAWSHDAVASRLSHFLWNSRPDQNLMNLASEKSLHDPGTLRHEVERMIRDSKFERFVQHFTDEWLDLTELRRDRPDIRLYPEYRKDDYLVESMERETRAFFSKLIRENLSVQCLVHSDFVMVNDTLSRHYGLPPVAGSAMREVPVPDGSPYGGLMTQGAIMKLTANGVSTSPVLRGAWIMKHILGDPPPPPPADVPTVVPDLRGAQSIREILAAHADSESCAKCHARFDPIGFAFENFDIMGAWRDHYRNLEKGDEITGIDRAGHRYSYRIGESVDASGKLKSGEVFENIDELKAILKGHTRRIARHLIEQWIFYATGHPVRFTDRRTVQQILNECEAEAYRAQDLLQALIRSPIFLGRHPHVEP